MMARKKNSDTGSTWVCLIPGNRTTFRRALRDRDDQVVEVYRFEPDSPLELNAKALALVRRDIGRALCICRPREDEGRFVIDWGATNEVHMKCFGTHVPAQANKSINVGASSERSKVVQPPPETNDAMEVGGDGDQVELSDDLVDLLERHQDKFVELSPEGVKAFLDDGNKLEDLDGFDEAKAREVKESLGVE